VGPGIAADAYAHNKAAEFRLLAGANVALIVAVGICEVSQQRDQG
jgi:hypothetical protein